MRTDGQTVWGGFRVSGLHIKRGSPKVTLGTLLVLLEREHNF